MTNVTELAKPPAPYGARAFDAVSEMDGHLATLGDIKDALELISDTVDENREFAMLVGPLHVAIDSLASIHNRLREQFEIAFHALHGFKYPESRDVGVTDPVLDAVNALARALERHKELCDNWETRCEAGQERPKAIDDALHEWEDLQLTLAQTPARTLLGALAKAAFLAMWAEDGDIAHHKALCRSIREDYARLRKEASHG